MKLLYTGILLFLTFTVSFAAAQKTDANINGHVTDARTNEHLPFVNIAVKGTVIGITTDATGHYFLKDMPTGEFTVAASAIGYKTREYTLVIEAHTTIELNFALDEQSLALGEVVVTATRNETRKQEAGIIVNVASAKLFETVSSSNLAETMCFQPGLRVENNCGNCGTAQLRINGLEGQYSQVLLNSRPVFSSLAAVYGLEQLPVAMIERVEVVRGGGSALFGSSAIGGVVNIITKEPLRNTLMLAHTTNIPGHGSLDRNTSINGSFVSDDHKAGVYVFGMIKDRDPYDHNRDGFSDIPQIGAETAGFRGYYRTGTYSKITAEYHHIHEMRRGGNNFDSPPHEADIAEYLNHKIDGGGLTFDAFSPDYKHRVSVYASAQAIQRNSYFAGERPVDIDSANYGATADQTAVAGVQYTLGFDRLWFMPAELTAGAEYSYNHLLDAYTGLDRHMEQTTHIAGAFVQNEWKNKTVGILIGARLDKHNMMRTPAFNPRGTFRYNPTNNVNLRASYAGGYRAPQAYSEDLHVEAVAGTVAVITINPRLKPEYSHSLSASADLYHAFGSVQTNLLVEGFYTALNGVFTLEKTGEDAQGSIVYTRRNGSGATVKGMNVEAKIALPGVLDVQLGYTYQQSRYTEPERWSDRLAPQRKMFRAPDSYGYFTSNFTVTPHFTASLFGACTGRMLVKHTLRDVDMEKTTPSFFDAGAKLAYHIHLSKVAEVELNGGVKNMFDSYQTDLDYGADKDGAYVYGPTFPRLFFAGVKVAF